MSSRVYDQNLIKTIALFESISGAKVHDCVQEHLQDAKGEFDLCLFIIEPGDMGRAIGPKGANVRRIEELLKKRIKLVEWNPDAQQFLQNLIVPAKIGHMEMQDKMIIVSPLDMQSRGIIIGRGASNLRFFESVMKRHFPYETIKVLGGQ